MVRRARGALWLCAALAGLAALASWPRTAVEAEVWDVREESQDDAARELDELPWPGAEGNVSAYPGAYWSALGVRGANASRVPTNYVAMGYCDELDLLVLSGGAIVTYDRKQGYTSQITAGVKAYDFVSGRYFELLSEAATAWPAVQKASLVRVAARAAGSCRFLLYGGTRSNLPGELAAVPAVFWLELSRLDGALVAASGEVEIEGGGPGGRLSAAVVGHRGNLFVFGGEGLPAGQELCIAYSGLIIMGTGDSTLPRCKMEEDLWRLALVDGAGNEANVTGSWKRLAAAPSRWNIGSAKLEPSTWVLYGGLSKPFERAGFLPENDVRYLDLNRLSEPAFGDSAADGASAVQGVPAGAAPARAFHSLAAVGGRLLSIMGLYSVPQVGAKFAMSVTTTTPELGRSPSRLACQLPAAVGGFDVEWCGFDMDLPGYSYDQQVVVRRDTVLLLSYRITRATSALFWELNVTRMYSEGQRFFRDWVVFELVPNDELSRAFLQYTLAGVCFMLLLSLGMLLKARQQRGHELMYLVRHKKSLGVSKDVIRALDFVTFDAHGGHRKVKLKWPEPAAPPPPATGDQEAPASVSANANATAAETPANPPAEPSGEPTIVEEGELDVVVELDPARPPRDAETCAICIMDFEQNDLLIRLPCKHLFHWDCVEPWLLKNGTCPQCRRHVVTGEELADKNTSVHGEDASSGQAAASASPSAGASAATAPEPAPHEPGDLAGARRVSLRASMRASLRRSRERRASRRDGDEQAPAQQHPQQQQQRRSLSHRLADMMPSFSASDAGSSSALAAHGGAEMPERRTGRGAERRPSI